MHLVGLGFHPVEEAFDAVPVARFPERFEFFGVEMVGFTVAVVDPFLFVLREIFEGAGDVDVAFAAIAEEVALAFIAAFALEGFDRALFDGERFVGDSLVEIDADDAAEAAAFRAGAEWAVE